MYEGYTQIPSDFNSPAANQQTNQQLQFSSAQFLNQSNYSAQIQQSNLLNINQTPTNLPDQTMNDSNLSANLSHYSVNSSFAPFVHNFSQTLLPNPQLMNAQQFAYPHFTQGISPFQYLNAAAAPIARFSLQNFNQISSTQNPLTFGKRSLDESDDLMSIINQTISTGQVSTTNQANQSANSSVQSSLNLSGDLLLKWTERDLIIYRLNQLSGALLQKQTPSEKVELIKSIDIIYQLICNLQMKTDEIFETVLEKKAKINHQQLEPTLNLPWSLRFQLLNHLLHQKSLAFTNSGKLKKEVKKYIFKANNDWISILQNLTAYDLKGDLYVNPLPAIAYVNTHEIIDLTDKNAPADNSTTVNQNKTLPNGQQQKVPVPPLYKTTLASYVNNLSTMNDSNIEMPNLDEPVLNNQEKLDNGESAKSQNSTSDVNSSKINDKIDNHVDKNSSSQMNTITVVSQSNCTNQSKGDTSNETIIDTSQLWTSDTSNSTPKNSTNTSKSSNCTQNDKIDTTSSNNNSQLQVRPPTKSAANENTNEVKKTPNDQRKSKPNGDNKSDFSYTIKITNFDDFQDSISPISSKKFKYCDIDWQVRFKNREVNNRTTRRSYKYLDIVFQCDEKQIGFRKLLVGFEIRLLSTKRDVPDEKRYFEFKFKKNETSVHCSNFIPYEKLTVANSNFVKDNNIFFQIRIKKLEQN